ncbi:Glycerophosphodiester phosphodiesterase GDPDL3 [Linum perenne]
MDNGEERCCVNLTVVLVKLLLINAIPCAGNYPIVVARGGFSGLLPDSSTAAYQLALLTSVPDLVLWCDLQLTKDAMGICVPDLKLDNSTDIPQIYKDRQKTYTVNGVNQTGWFPSDFTSKELSTVALMQGVYSRSPNFDSNLFPILTVEDVAGLKPAGLWLNVQHDAFYAQRNLSMRNYVIATSRRVVINYISSPEVGFLRSISTRFNPNITKLFFRFNGKSDIEPSTNQTYGSLLSNLTFIRSFAAGIVVPKTYIWPLDASNYLLPSTSVVLDAHKAGLEVVASEFYNDAVLSYNYSYDPVSEYLQYVDNGQFSAETLSNFSTNVPELKGNGIYTFSLPWSQIQTLTPVISNPYPSFQLVRNPKMRNAGKLVSLSDFLALAKNSGSLSGILIRVENAAYLMEKQGLAVLDTVESELSKAGYDNQTALKVMIQSTNSSVLMKLKEKNKYELVYEVDETIGGADTSAISDIKNFAHSVVISKSSVFPVNNAFLTGMTNVVSKLQSAELPVYVQTFSNEFASQPWDFFGDANVEINTFISGTNITGVVTDFPRTSARYKKNRCLNEGNKAPVYMIPVQAGSLLGIIQPQSLPPAQAPNPPLTENDVAEAPLPAVGNRPTDTSGGGGATPPSPGNGQPKGAVTGILLSSLAMLLTAVWLL